MSPLSWQRRTASAYVVLTNASVFLAPEMQSSLDSDNWPVAVAFRRHVLPSQHCAAIGSLSTGSVVAVGSVTHAPELSSRSPSNAQTPSLGKTIGERGGSEGGSGWSGGSVGGGGRGGGEGGNGPCTTFAEYRLKSM